MAISVAPTRIKTVLKQELRLSYRRTRTTPPQANAQRCLVLRQQYALAIMPLLERRSRILNVDETWLSESTFVRKHWAPKGQPATIPNRTISPRLAIIAAIDTDGRVWFALT